MSFSDISLGIQARMSSSRFPCKVIADFRGSPLIVFLYNRLKTAFPLLNITVLTSDEPSDDKLADVLKEYQIPFFRGSLNNVLMRFHDFASATDENVKFIGRICADSPLISTEIIKAVMDSRDSDFDIMTTRYYQNGTLKSTAPKGQNFDLIKKTSLLSAALEDKLSPDDIEHVIFPFMRKKTLNVDVSSVVCCHADMAVDTPEDLNRIRGIE